MTSIKNDCYKILLKKPSDYYRNDLHIIISESSWERNPQINYDISCYAYTAQVIYYL